VGMGIEQKWFCCEGNIYPVIRLNSHETFLPKSTEQVA